MPRDMVGSRDPHLGPITSPPITPPALPTTADLIPPGIAPSLNDEPANSVHQVAVPFSDFVGRCFMRAFLLAELFDLWVRSNQVPTREQANSAAAKHYDWHVAGWLRSSMGAVLCTVAAASLVAIFWSRSSRSWVPFVFLIVISYIALRFGDIAGLIGTISAALLFASILFEPRPSLAMSNPVERHHLLSMVILGIFASEFFGRHRKSTRYKPW